MDKMLSKVAFSLNRNRTSVEKSPSYEGYIFQDSASSPHVEQDNKRNRISPPSLDT